MRERSDTREQRLLEKSATLEKSKSCALRFELHLLRNTRIKSSSW